MKIQNFYYNYLSDNFVEGNLKLRFNSKVVDMLINVFAK